MLRCGGALDGVVDVGVVDGVVDGVVGVVDGVGDGVGDGMLVDACVARVVVWLLRSKRVDAPVGVWC